MTDALALIKQIIEWGVANLLTGQGLISDVIVVAIVAPIAFRTIRGLISLAG